MKINIVIDSLSLEGFNNHNSESIMAALQSHLSQLIKNNESQFSYGSIKRAERLTAFDESIETNSNTDNHSIGAGIARSIYDKIIS